MSAMSSPPETQSVSRVVAVVSATTPVMIAETLVAVRSQLYESVTAVVVGGDKSVREEARVLGVPWHASAALFLASADTDIKYVWFLRAGVIPDPIALDALVGESERHDAAVVGSKLISADDRTLISVGMTTDVFGVDATELGHGEVDQGQYDVLRDVAGVLLLSALVRRDLAKGIGVDERVLTNEGAALAFCNRARLAGARIVTAPSSVAHVSSGVVKAKRWAVEADRIQSMITSYSVLTLSWALPMRLLIGVIEAVGTLFARPWTGPSTLRAWVWNVVHSLEAVRRRRATRQVRVKGIGDAELFRFQVPGSAALRSTGIGVMDALRDRIVDRGGFDVDTLTEDLRQPAFVAGGLGTLFVLFVTRTVVSGGTVVSGFNGPLPVDGDLFGAYAGGWNPAGFGSGDPLPPIIGLFGIADKVLPFSSAFAYAVVLVVTIAAGVWGMARLLKLWGVGAVAGVIGGIGYTAGPAAAEFANRGLIGSTVALGFFPWAVLAVLRPLPRSAKQRFGWFSRVAVTSGLVMMAEPGVALALFGVLFVWLVVAARGSTPWIGVVPALIGIGVGVVSILPWVMALDDPSAWVKTGSFFWDVSPIVAGGMAAVVIGSVLGVSDRMKDVATWAGIVAAAGVLLARIDASSAVSIAGIALAALGVGAAAAVAMDTVGTERRGGTNVGVVVVGVGMVALAGSIVIAVIGGRIGFETSELVDATAFITSSEPQDTATKVLVIGDSETIPGDVREIRGATYRVIPASGQEIWDLQLGRASTGDAALDRILGDMIDGNEFRGGARLAAMGIGWAVVVDESPLEAVLRSQLDVDAVGAGESVAFAMPETPGAVVSDTGEKWVVRGTGFVGPSTDGAVFLGVNPNSYWDLNSWQQESWGNSVDGSSGEITFAYRPSTRRRAYGALLAMAGFAAVAWWGRSTDA